MFNYFPENRVWSFYVQRLIDEAMHGGADFNEMHRTLRRVRDGNFEDWHQEWVRTAQHVEGLAEAAEKAGHRVTARDAFFRAFSYYRTAQFFLHGPDPRQLPTYLKATDCFRRGNSLRTPPFEKVEIAFEGATLPGYFLPPQGANGRAPGVLFLGGADTFAEQLLFMGATRIAERGMGCLVISGPGQGDVLRLQMIPSRPDYEKPAGAALSYLEGRPEVDAQRLGVIGISMGGYYAPRTASLDPRVKACVAWGASYDLLEDLYTYYPPIQAHLRWVIGAADDAEARQKLRAFTLKGVVSQMTCPLLICTGADDFITRPEAAAKTYEEARCPKELKVWTAEEGGSSHCMADNRSEALPYMHDWLADRLK
ncbi:MAG: alpha/beta hydrolase [Deltaproteobacteria bacterium]|nr:alpha/beta hydrolase [Deltaproteobacteria bacterium]